MSTKEERKLCRKHISLIKGKDSFLFLPQAECNILIIKPFFLVEKLACDSFCSLDIKRSTNSIFSGITTIVTLHQSIGLISKKFTYFMRSETFLCYHNSFPFRPQTFQITISPQSFPQGILTRFNKVGFITTNFIRWQVIQNKIIKE